MTAAANRQALLVIDMQSGLLPGAHREDEVIDVVNHLIGQARRAATPIVFVQHNHASYPPLMKGATGWCIDPRLARLPEDLIVEKSASDAFYHTDLEERLTAEGVEELVVTGLQSEYCVDTTCRAALSRGFDVVLVADGHTTGDSHLDAAAVVDHHNRILANLAHPTAGLSVRPGDAVTFARD